MGGLHETYERKPDVQGSSNRSFGLVFCGFFLIVGLLPLIKGGDTPHYWLLGLSGLFLVLAFTVPQALTPLNHIWFKFGLLLHKIVNPLVMGVLFFLTITPMALILRLMGKDPLRRKFDPAASSYWISRTPAGPAPKSLKNQF